MTLTVVQAMVMVIVVAQAMARNNGKDDLCWRGREGSEEDDLCQGGRECQLSRRGIFAREERMLR